MKSIYETDDYLVEREDSPETYKAAYDALWNWFKKNDLYSGESIQSMDVTWEEAPDLLTEIAEKVFKFKTEWK